MNKLKLKWMHKLARTRNYVILTDTESMINVKGLSSENMADIQKTAYHLQMLEVFREQLEKVIKDYEKAISKQLAIPGGGKKKVTKIKVKQG